MRASLVLAVASVAGALFLAAPASASLSTLKASCDRRDAADGNAANGFRLPFYFCDDGTPGPGGRTPNEGALNAVAVPQRYGGDGYSGLPPKAPAEPGTGADSRGDIALDTDVTLPDPARFRPPARGYPLVVFMHGCCSGSRQSWEDTTIDGGGEHWHYNNAWFASRGYAVLTYTARGFVDKDGHGSTGETQLDSRRYEINDYQHLAGQLADTTFTVGGRTVRIDGSRVIPTGGSYGGGFAWLALTDPTWRSPRGKSMKVVAVATKYGWTNLVESLVPHGTESQFGVPSSDPASAASPLGFPKTSFVTALYTSGKTGLPPPASHTTFPTSIDDAFACLQSTDPFESNPLCSSTIASTLPVFVNDRSAYFQNAFFARLRRDRRARVPVFSAGTTTDKLFPMPEHRRMARRLLSIVRNYPLEEYYGDYNHAVQNKPKEWADLCGSDHHRCRFSDYPNGNLNARPRGLVRVGIDNRLNRFVDYYARPQGDPRPVRPRFDVTASLQICPSNASSVFPADEPGERFTERSFGALAPRRQRFIATGTQVTTNKAAPNPHAANDDPIKNYLTNDGGACPVDTDPPGPGVAAYEFGPLTTDLTMIGQTRVSVPHTGAGSGIQLNARLYDVHPDGTAVLTDRGVRRVTSPNETTVFDLHGAGWRFPKGHSVRIELTQDDEPYVKHSNQPSQLTISGVTLDMPVRTTGPSVRVSVRLGAARRNGQRLLTISALPTSGELTGTKYLQLAVRGAGGRYRTLAAASRTGRVGLVARRGRSYRFRARSVDVNGAAGPWAYATVRA